MNIQLSRLEGRVLATLILADRRYTNARDFQVGARAEGVRDAVRRLRSKGVAIVGTRQGYRVLWPIPDYLLTEDLLLYLHHLKGD